MTLCKLLRAALILLASFAALPAFAWDAGFSWIGAPTSDPIQTPFAYIIRGYDLSTSAIDSNGIEITYAAYFYKVANPVFGRDAPIRTVFFRRSAPARYAEPNGIAGGGAAALGALSIVIAQVNGPNGAQVPFGPANMVAVSVDGQ